MRVIAILVLVLSACAPAEKPDLSDIHGAFVNWEPVDDDRGYAIFTVTNDGTEAGTAQCIVQVLNDFGNFGTDSMAGERIEAGDTRSFRIAMTVPDGGGLLINRGTVTNC